jgi:STE24 endopeptidase
VSTTPTAVRDRASQQVPDLGPSELHDSGASHELPPAETRSDTRASIAAAVMVLGCLLARLPDRLLHETGLRGWVAGLVGVIALVSGARVIARAPFTFARRSVSASMWVAQQCLALAGTIAVGAVLTLPLYALIRASSAWWLWAWLLFAGVTVVGQAAMPLVLRAQVGPMIPAPLPLARRVLVIGAQAGVDLAGGVLIAGKANTKRPRCNAYVVGLGPSRRVVLEPGVAAWPPELIDQVVAHEIGHWRLGHTARRLPITLAAQLTTFALAAAILSFQPLLDIAGVAHPGDPRSYPLLLALTGALVLPARLLLARYDRSQERAADRFALGVLGEPEAFARMLDRAADDGGAARQLPWWRHLVAGHPPIDERILACQQFVPAT